MIVDEQLIRLLKTNTLFKGVSLTILKPYVKPKNFFQVKEGEIIYNTDSDATELYLVVEGEVKLKFCQDRHIEIKYILDFFGEVEILKNCKRISFAVANMDSTLYRISSSEILLLSETNEVLNRNLKKLNVVKDSKNHAGDNKLNEILIHVNQDLVDKKDIDKVELDNEEQNKILSDQELESILEKQKSIKELHTVLKKITDVPDIDELGLEE